MSQGKTRKVEKKRHANKASKFIWAFSKSYNEITYLRPEYYQCA